MQLAKLPVSYGHTDGLVTYSDIKHVETNSTHGLFGENTFLGRPLESRNAMVLDFVEVLNTLGNINEKIGASAFRAKAPNFPGVRNIPIVLVGENTSSGLEIVASTNFSALNVLCQLLVER